MSFKHHNPTQMASSTIEVPLIKNESPYYNNLNRFSINAFTYVEGINDILRQGGCVSRVRSTSQDPISLYKIVKLLDGEVIISTSNYVSKKERFGIVVADKDSDGFYTICTFTPNLVLPPDIIQFKKSDIGSLLSIDTKTYEDTISNILVSSGEDDSEVLIGMVTGEHSIFFCGTIRLFNYTKALTETGLFEFGFTY